MHDAHLTDPLEYLYEELPPERMAEARRHLAECPDCRREIREIRETVKQYRQTPRPVPPEGLAERTARAAIGEADKGAVGLLRGRFPAPARAVPPPETAEQRQEKLEEDFKRLKDDFRA